jgi:hypothetical protein
MRREITDRSALPNALSHKLIRNFTSVPARRFSRIPRSGHVEVVFGLRTIHAALLLARLPGPHGDSPANEVLQRVDTDLIADPAFGTGRYTARSDTAPEDPRGHWQLWDVVNLGAGGYQLHWPQRRPSGAQVGELLAVRVVDERETRVYAGAVRWLQAREDGDLDIGVQLLAPKVVPIHIQPEEEYLVDNLSANPGLWLPPVKALKQPATVITPVGRFRPGSHVVAVGSRNRYALELGDRVESTGLFERFDYRVLQRRVPTTPPYTAN